MSTRQKSERSCLVWACVVLMVVIFGGKASAAQIGGEKVIVMNTRRPIVIDAKLGKDEWADATVISGLAGSMNIADTQTRVYLTYDEKYLYMAFHSDIPEEAKKNPDERLLHGFLQKMTAHRDESKHIGHDDTFYIQLIPRDPDGRKYLLRVNGIETIYDGWRDADGGVSLLWDSKWDVKSHVDMGGWIIESRIPLADFGIDRIKDGEEWKFQFSRNWKLLKNQVDSWPAWSMAPRKGWMRGMGTVLFRRDDGISVQTFEFHEVSPGRIRLRGSLRNHSSEKKDVLVALSAGEKVLSECQRVLKPKETAGFELNADLRQVKAKALSYEVVSQRGREIYYAQKVPWSAEGGLALTLRSYPSLKLITVSWELARIEQTPEQLRAEIEILDKEDETPVLKKTVAPLPSCFGEVEVGVADIPDGRYRVRMTIRDKNKTLLNKVVDYEKQPLPEWWGNQLGISDKVPPPWTPMKVEGDAVCMWGRRYEFNGRILPEKIINQGRQILAGPMAFTVTDARGKTYDSSRKSCRTQWEQRAETEVRFTRTQTVGPVRITNKSVIEFDGMQWMELEIAPAKDQVSISGLTLSIPLKKQYAHLINNYHCMMGELGEIPEEGVTSMMGMRWVGWEEGGIQVFCETSANWITADRKQEYEVVRSASAVEMRMHIIGKPAVLEKSKPLRVALGFIVTPTKQTVKHRDILTGGIPLRADDPKRPFDKGRINYNKLAVKHHKNLRLINIWNTGWWKRHPACTKKSGAAPFYPFVRDDLPASFGKDTTSYGATVWKSPYFQQTLAWVGSPEFRQFGDEWVGNRATKVDDSFRHADLSALSGRRVYITPGSRSYRDFYLHGVNQFFDKTLAKDIYFDVSRPRISNNIYSGLGLKLSDGTVVATEGFLGSRRLLQRIYTLQKQKHPDGLILFHMSGQVAMPVYSFCDAMVDGEHFIGVLDRKNNRGYERVLPLDKYAAEFAAQNNFGPYSIFLPQFHRSGSIKPDEWAGIGYQPAEYILGLIFLHNSQMWFSAYTVDEPCLELYRAFDVNGLDSSCEYTGYWKQDAVRLPENVKASFYVSADKQKAFMLIMNFAWEDRTLDLQIDPSKIDMKPSLSEVRMLYPQGEIQRAGNTLKQVKIPAKNFRLILIEGTRVKP